MLACVCILLFFTIRGALKARGARKEWQINDT
jgi:hypothetical protein